MHQHFREVCDCKSQNEQQVECDAKDEEEERVIVPLSHTVAQPMALEGVKGKSKTKKGGDTRQRAS